MLAHSGPIGADQVTLELATPHNMFATGSLLKYKPCIEKCISKSQDCFESSFVTLHTRIGKVKFSLLQLDDRVPPGQVWVELESLIHILVKITDKILHEYEVLGQNQEEVKNKIKEFRHVLKTQSRRLPDTECDLQTLAGYMEQHVFHWIAKQAQLRHRVKPEFHLDL